MSKLFCEGIAGEYTYCEVSADSSWVYVVTDENEGCAMLDWEQAAKVHAALGRCLAAKPPTP